MTTTGAERRIFLLSPASCGGRRARLLFDPRARFDLARALRTTAGVPLGQVFSFMSGLYFRGKLEYARTYARPPDGSPGVFIVTSGEGLCVPETRVRPDVLERWAAIPIDTSQLRYTEPPLRDARPIATGSPASGREVALPGGVATGKPRRSAAGRLRPAPRVPADFVGRGDMSRGPAAPKRAGPDRACNTCRSQAP